MERRDFFFKKLCTSILVVGVITNLHSDNVLLKSTGDFAKKDVHEQDISFHVHNPVRQFSKLQCLMLVIGDCEQIDKIAKIMQFDLEFSDQIAIEVKRSKAELDQKVLSKLFAKGIALCLYVEQAKKATEKSSHFPLHVVLKDPSSGQVFFEKKCTLPNHSLIYSVHRISDELMPLLAGQKGPMLSTLAYCKQISPRHKVVCVADYACKLEKIVVPARTINVAPCWHSKAPVLFYSQFARSKARLMSLDLANKKHRIVCSYDGLSMQPSFSPDGSKAVLCLSGGGNSELYFYDQILCNKLKKRIFKPITSNHGNNASPCYLPNGNVVFCSDFQTKFPQIYLYDAQKKSTKRLTNGRGYCAAPAYCAVNNSIVYTRYVKGFFQLFTMSLDVKKGFERQLTFAKGDKLEPTWSECGRYVAFAYSYVDPHSQKLSNQIAVLNVPSGKIRVLTAGAEPKSFPSWTSRTMYTT